MNKNTRSMLHSALVEAGIIVYESAEAYQSAVRVCLDVISEARETLSAKEFAEWGTSEFGTGGARMADGWIEGAVPHALRADGRLMQRARGKGDEADSAANRVNTLVSDNRAIIRACVDHPAFEFGASFRETYKAARALYSTAKTADTATKRDKGAKESSAPVDLKSFTTFAESHFTVALEALERILVKRKDTIRAATLGAIRAQLIANSK